MKQQIVQLGMGQIAFASKPVYIRTVVGGCIAVTMYDSQTHFSAMCHALYPGEKECCLYAIDCVKKMAQKFRMRSIPLNTLEVKFFGVASKFSNNGIISPPLQKKLEHLSSVIREMGISYIKTDLGGIKSREILFDTQTGKVLLKYLEDTLTDTENADG